MTHKTQPQRPLARLFGRISCPRLKCPEASEMLRYVATTYAHLLPNGHHSYTYLSEQIARHYDTQSDSPEAHKHRTSIDFLQCLASQACETPTMPEVGAETA